MKALIFSDLHLNNPRWRSGPYVDTLFPEEDFDVLLLGGDNAEPSPNRENHYRLFDHLQRKIRCPIAFVAGNHDIWDSDPSHTAEELLFGVYPEMAMKMGVHYLETTNLDIKNWTIVGTYGHYDYSFPAVDDDRQKMKDVETGRLITFTESGKVKRERTYQDFLKINMGKTTNPDLCNKILDRFEMRVRHARGSLMTISHTLPDISFAGTSAEARSPYSGSKRLGEIIKTHWSAYHFCGHTHHYFNGKFGSVDAVNIGSGGDTFRYVILDTTSSKKIKTISCSMDNPPRDMRFSRE
ncbi:MAG: metallophosphoesterase [archaeon]